MGRYSIGVALFDYLPVMVSAGGLLLLARGIAARHQALASVAYASVALIATGGLCKASWKLILATQQQHIAWLENMLFILLAPGFVALAYSLFHARHAWQTGLRAQAARYSATHLLLWLSLPLLIGAALAYLFPGTRSWFFGLLAITTLANAAMLTHAIIATRWSGLGFKVVAGFALSFAGSLALSGLSRLPPTEASAWLQEAVNLSTQLALAFGCWHLAQRMQEHT